MVGILNPGRIRTGFVGNVGLLFLNLRRCAVDTEKKSVEIICAVVRVHIESGQYVIFFPDDYNPRNGCIGSWQWVGQHGEASYGFARRPYTRPASADETARAFSDYIRCYSGINGEHFTLRELKRLRRPVVHHAS
jgi:hypothetical protein